MKSDFSPAGDQPQAIAELTAGLRAHEKNQVLLGVTGSGKTEVYLAALEAALAEGGGVCFLVPEVALAPQTVGRLRARLEGRLGTRVVVWHSHLAAGERLDAWHALASGAARVVVGARSAIFATVRNLRLVLVDEEHEPAYKQSESPRYHGRDITTISAVLSNQALARHIEVCEQAAGLKPVSQERANAA